MTGREHEPQQIVADFVVQRGIEIGCVAPRFHLVGKFLVFPLEQLVPPPVIDRAMLGGGHEPGPRIPRLAGLRPLLKCRNECLLRQVLGHSDITHNAGESGNEPWGLDTPDRVDGAMGVGRCHGSITPSSTRYGQTREGSST
jgi:hypothetical protein